MIAFLQQLRSSPDCMRSASSNLSCANRLIGWMSNILHHILGGGVDGDLLNIDLGLLRNILHASLALSLLKLQRDTTNGSLLDSLHEMSDETGDLVSESLGGDDGNLLRDLLVQLEVHSQLRVVLLDNVSSGSLDSLGSDSSHLIKDSTRS